MFYISKLCVVWSYIGCGGYIVSTGNVLKPAYPPSENSSAECVWYIESSGPGNTTLITSQSRAMVPFPVIVSFFIFNLLDFCKFSNLIIFSRLTMAGLQTEPLFTMVHQEPQFIPLVEKHFWNFQRGIL